MADNRNKGKPVVIPEPEEDVIPSTPAPSEPEPSVPIPSEPIPSEPAPSEPIPSEPAPIEPPVESQPAPEPPQAPVEPPKPVVEPIEPEPIQVPAVTPPSDEELRSILAADGIDLDELTQFEKVQAKKTYMMQKHQELINESLQAQNKRTEWSKKIDTFIDSTNNDPKYAGLSGHEVEFKRFAMQHTDSDIEALLLPAFLHTLPATPPKRGSLMEHGGGGPPPPQPPSDVITDADMAKKLKEADPREYARKLKAGKIKIEVD